jgi:hypothetical protein
MDDRMSDVINALEDALDVMLHVTGLPEYYDEVAHVRYALDKLKSSRYGKHGEDRIVRCNWCESVFYEDHIHLKEDEEYCPVCGKTGYLMDMPEAENRPRWETPKQYKARTGKAWPEDWAVYTLYKTELIYKKWWFCESYHCAKTTMLSGDRVLAIVCATEAGCPPDDWMPEGTAE